MERPSAQNREDWWTLSISSMSETIQGDFGPSNPGDVPEKQTFAMVDRSLDIFHQKGVYGSTFKGVTNGSPYTTKGPPLDTP